MADRWPALLTIAEACEYLGCEETFLRENFVGQGMIKPVQLSPRLIKYRRDELDRIIEDLPRGGGKCNANIAKERRVAETRAKLKVKPA